MSRYISSGLRQRIAVRADFLCEYCLIAEEDTFFGCHVEHIISLKHGGTSTPGNLAYACAFCNRYKGTDIASISQTGQLTRFFNPRTDRWASHFRLNGSIILTLSVVGEVTAGILRFNDGDRVLEREVLSASGRYPNKAAKIRSKR
jgi:hypothetical protein